MNQGSVVVKSSITMFVGPALWSFYETRAYEAEKKTYTLAFKETFEQKYHSQATAQTRKLGKDEFFKTYEALYHQILEQEEKK